MREIKPLHPVQASVAVPGSKSVTHRVLIAAALSDGPCRIENALASEDTGLTRQALERWGVRIEPEGEGLRVFGTGGDLAASPDPILLGNSGTSMRLLTAVAALARGRTVLSGTARLQARPIQDLLDGLAQVGVAARSLAGNGCPPVAIDGGGIAGGRASLNCSLSSQFLSALLLIGPYTHNGLEIHVTRGPVSRPYIDITLDTMRDFGVEAERDGYSWFKVGSTICVRGTRRNSRQGDIRILEIFERMGCRVESRPEGVAVAGGPLKAVEVDMGDIPDVVPTVAVTAAFARGRTLIRNVAHLKEKESDRLAAVSTGLNRMGIDAGCDGESLWVEGGSPQPAAIDCRDDHRIAMSFAVAGLKAAGIIILDETCVRKSFPGFWQTLDALYR